MADGFIEELLVDRPAIAPTVNTVINSSYRPIAPRRSPSLRAFTLIELVVVLVVLSIITAMSVATYSQVEQSAQNKAAQVALLVTASEASNYFTEWNQFPNYGTFPRLEPSYTFIDGSTPGGLSQGPTQVSVYVHVLNSEPLLTVTDLSSSGTCFEMTEAPPNSPTPNAYIITTASYCYASNPFDSSTGVYW